MFRRYGQRTLLLLCLLSGSAVSTSFAIMNSPFVFAGGADGDVQINAGGAFDGRTLTAGSGITISTSLTAITITAAASAGTPGGSHGQVQYNNSGAFGANADFVFSTTTHVLTLGKELVINNPDTTLAPSILISGTGNISSLGDITMDKTGNNFASNIYYMRNSAARGLFSYSYVFGTDTLTMGLFGSNPSFSVTNSGFNFLNASNSSILINFNTSGNDSSIFYDGSDASYYFNGSIGIQNQFPLRLYTSGSSNYTAIRATGTQTYNILYTMPATTGTINQALAVNQIYSDHVDLSWQTFATALSTMTTGATNFVFAFSTGAAQSTRVWITSMTVSGQMNLVSTSTTLTLLSLQGIASQTGDYFNVFNSAGTKLTAFLSDGAWLIPTAVGTTDSLTYKTDGLTGNHTTELRIKRAYGAQNNGAGAQLALEDAGNGTAPAAYFKYESAYFIVNRSDLNIYAQVGRVLRFPWNGGSEWFTGGAFAVDDYNNVGGVITIPPYEYAVPGGPPERATIFSIYQSSFNTSAGAGPVNNAAAFYIAGAPWIIGDVAKIGTYAMWVDSGTTRLDGDVQQWLLNSTTESVVSVQRQTWDDSTYATRKGRLTHYINDTTQRTSFYEKADGTSAWVVFPATMTLSAGVTVQAVVPTTGQVLKYDGTNWAPGTDSTGSGGASSKTINLDVSQFYVNFTSGAAGPSQIELSTTTMFNFRALEFADTSSKTFASIDIAMPNNWDGLPFTMQFIWTSSVTISSGVVWGCGAYSYATSVTLNQTRGTDQIIASTTTGTAYQNIISSVTPNITAGGSPAGGQILHIWIYRDAGNATDVLPATAYLRECRLKYGSTGATE